MEELNAIMDGLNDEAQDVVDTPAEAMSGVANKRAFLRTWIRDDKKIPGSRAKWTIEKLNKCSHKEIERLYSKIVSPEKKVGDPISRMAGVKDINLLMKDINSNHLIRNSGSTMIGHLTNKMSFSSHTPMEILGSHIYEKFGMVLGPITLFSLILTHLDWATFQKIADERKLNNNNNEDDDDIDEPHGRPSGHYQDLTQSGGE